MAKSKYRYNNYLSTNFKRANYSWASSYTYVQPDYKKIREEIKQEQIKYNNMWVWLKVGYWTKVMIERKYLWLTKSEVTKAKDVKTIVSFAEQTENLGIVDLGIVDWFIMQMLYFGNPEQYTTDAKWNEIWPKEAMLSKDNYELYRAYLNKKLDAEIKKQQQENWKRGQHWGWVWAKKTIPLKKERIDKLKEEMLMRLTSPRDIFQREASLRKGKRINRNFVYGLSYKPLMQEQTEKVKKKKVLNIVDGSGSMWINQKDPIFVGWEFMYALSETGLFDCENFFSQTQTLSRWDDFQLYCYSWWEWFADMPARLVDMWVNVNDFDYVFVFTDCCIDTRCKNALNEMLSKKKHILFCCEERNWDYMREDYPALKIVDVKTTADMVNNLVSYV